MDLNENAVDDFEAFLNFDDHQLASNFSMPLLDPNAQSNPQDFDHMQQQQRQAAQQQHLQQDGFQGMQYHGYDANTQQHFQAHPSQMGAYGQMQYGQMNPDAMSAAQYHPTLHKTLSGQNYHQTINGAPPTPHSGEMHGKSASFQQPRGNPQYQIRSGDPNAFTPYLSPELDGSASVMSHAQGYATPGMYNLSPLTSPAMGPQHGMDPRAPRSHPVTANGSLVGSPVETMNQEPDDEEESARPRKTRKTTPARKLAASNASRQRKAPPTSTPRMRGGLNIQNSDHNGSSTGSSDSPYPTDQAEALRRNGSASSSISPRPLADAIMAPPPKPQTPTAGPGTPNLQQQPQTQQQNQPQQPTHPQQNAPQRGQHQPQPFQNNGRPVASPATPTSMMKLKSPGGGPLPGSASGSVTGDMQSPALESSMEFLKLPEAAAPIRADEGPSSSKLAQLPKLKTRSSAGDSVDSPRTSAVASPAGPQGSVKDGKNRIAKKRNSSSSNLVSPALRPKVSPSVKPLLPEGTPIDSQTHALLLASRSNYENILSGSHLPGVSYPADLSANLTSKRTSHKIAEQGRRNRINLALQEMQTLLPASYAALGSPLSQTADGGETKSNKNGSKTPQTPTAQGGSSKAATVECAIEYIKHLQSDTNEKDAAIERMKQEIETLRLKAGESASL